LFGSLNGCAIRDVVHKGHPTDMIRIDDSFSGTSCVNDETYPSGSDMHMHVSRIFNVHAGKMEI